MRFMITTFLNNLQQDGGEEKGYELNEYKRRLIARYKGDGPFFYILTSKVSSVRSLGLRI